MAEESKPEVNLLMWMIETAMDWVPAPVWHLLVIAGLIGYFITFIMRFIPFMGIYALPIRIASFLVLLGSVYVEGALPYRQMAEKAEEVVDEGNKQAVAITNKTDEAVQEGEKQIDKEKENLQGQVGALFGKNKELEAKAAEERRKAAEANANFGKMSAAEKEAFNRQFKEQEAKHQKELEDARRANQECPIPNAVVDQINKAVKGEKQ